jgi:hypothetical protein
MRGYLIFSNLEGDRHGGHGRVIRRGLRVEAQLLQLSASDHNRGQLDVVLLTVQHLLDLGIYDDDFGRPWYLELEVGVAGDGHKLDITWPPKDDGVGFGEVDHLEGESLGAVVAHVSKSDGQIDLPEWDGLLACDHFVEWVQMILSRSRPSPSLAKVLRYMRFRPLPPSMRSLSQVVPTSGSTMRENLPAFETQSRQSVRSNVTGDSDHRRYTG